MKRYIVINIVNNLSVALRFAMAWVLVCMQAAYAQVDYPPVPNSSIDSQIYNFAQLNVGEFGNGSGTDQHPNGYALNINLNDIANSPSASSTDTACNTLFKLSYEIYDVDYDGEVRVYLNNMYLAFVRATGENTSERRKIEFCGSLLVEGNNLIEFRVENNSRVWSVKDILLKYMNINSINISSNSNSALAYGNGFGTDKHPDYLVANFNAEQDKTQVLSVSGWDMDRTEEVSVYFNDNFMGIMTPGCDRCLGDTTLFELGKELILPGLNQLLFVQRSPNEQWGITNLVLRPKSTIAPILNLLLM